MNKSKKIISLLSAVALTVSAFTFSGCSDNEYKGDPLPEGYISQGEASSNGGFVVERGECVYFINGQETYTADNTYGEVVKGSLMCINKADLAAKKYDAARIVVPSLMVSGDYNSGVYIYGDYVYYATPTVDENSDGEVQNSHLDFKRARLDGTEAPMGDVENYFFRLTSNTTEYRYVRNEGSKTVYCLYEEGGALKSYNVDTGATVTLVKGASEYYYDTANPANPNVYYTMSLSYDVDTDKPTAADYNQIYCVNAASYAKTTASTATYEVRNGNDKLASYTFDVSYLNKKNEEAEEDGADEEDFPYDLGDYTTYPYVNLGSLVLDGVSKMGNPGNDDRYNKDDVSKAADYGYTYTIQSHQEGALYFKRVPLVKNSEETEKLYYLPAERTEWNTVTANDLDNGKISMVSNNLTNASATALYVVNGDGSHTYFHFADGILKKTDFVGGKEVTTNLEVALSGITLWQVRGEYLYYYASGTNGNNLSRIKHTGTQHNYDWDKAYDPVTLPLVDWNDSWYKPEFVTVNGKELLLYSNAQSFGNGGRSYEYVYGMEVGTNEELEQQAKDIEEVNEFIDGYQDTNADLVPLMQYYFRTGETKAYDDVKDLYETYEQEQFDLFVAEFAEGGKFEGRLEASYIKMLGKMSDEDAEDVEEDWKNSLLSNDEEETEEEGMGTWAIVLIVCGGSLFVAAVAFFAAKSIKKKQAKKRREEAVVNAYKRKRIDTTDDKTIDVYADEDTVEEFAEEAPEQLEEEAQEE